MILETGSCCKRENWIVGKILDNYPIDRLYELRKYLLEIERQGYSQIKDRSLSNYKRDDKP